MTKMVTMPIYGKNLRNQNDLETWYAASSVRVLPSCSNDDPGVTMTYFMARSNFVLYGKKLKQWIFQKLLSSMI